MKKYFMIAAAALLAFAGCDKGGIDYLPVDDAIVITPERTTFSAQGGEQEVIVTTNVEAGWTLTAAESYDWITATATKGEDGSVITFRAAENATDAEKSAEFTFKAGNATAKYVAVILGAKGTAARTLSLESAPALDLVYTTTKVEVIVNTTINYRALECTSSADWMTHKVTVVAGEGQALAGFVLEPNAGTENRTGEITIAAEGVEPVKVAVTQRAQPFITPEKTEHVIGLEGGKAEFTVSTNVEYTVTLDDAGKAWLTYEGKKNGKETFSCTANAENRYAVATLTEKNPIEGVDPCTVTVKIRQSKPALIYRAVDMTGARAYPVVWGEPSKTNLTNTKTVTYEALIKANDFSNQLSTVMGIEGNYLFRIGDAGIPGNRIQIASSSNVAAPGQYDLAVDTWYHVAVVYDGTDNSRGYTSIYINGELAIKGTSKTASSSWWNPTTTDITLTANHSHETNNAPRCFWIGYAYDGNRDFKGLMSELRVWSRCLTEAEINAENHFYTVPVDSEGLEAYWKMDDGTADGKFKDYTGHGNDLQCELNIRNENDEWIGDNGCNMVDVSLPE